jgi:hypothetical protein
LQRPAARSLLALLSGTLLLGAAGAAGAEPLRVSTRNPRYLEWQGKATVLVTSAEHYGAVVNPKFDLRRYLDTLAKDGLNYTRLFTGTYIEPVGAFGIERNTLAPAEGTFLAPWARSDTPGYAGGGNKFDLERFDPAYLARLKEFLTEAAKRGIFVELTLFCATYSDKQWALHPFNPANNVQALPVTSYKSLHTLDNGGVLAYQEKLVRHLARELNGFDNLFYEIQNEPWADHAYMGDFLNPYMVKEHKFPNAVQVTAPVAVAWQAAIAKALQDEEARLPKKHLIAQNVANFRLPLRDEDLVPGVGLVNFHYAWPEALTWNRGRGVAIGFDESGFAGTADATYRRQAWVFLMNGGALFNNLDYSFSVGREDGTDRQDQSPGGGSVALRAQLGVLRRFLAEFDLAAMSPDAAFVRHAPGAVAHTLSAPGKAYAVYLQGRGTTTVTAALPAGRWEVRWVSPVTGAVVHTEVVRSTGAPVRLETPAFAEELAARIVRK